jgi:hypothetical protein
MSTIHDGPSAATIHAGPAPAVHDGPAVTSITTAFLFPPAAPVFGHWSNHRARRAGRARSGLAIAGTVLGYMFTAITAMAIALSAALASGIESAAQAPAAQSASSAAAAPAPAKAAGPGTAYKITSTDISGATLSTYTIRLDKQVTEPAPPDPQYAMPGSPNLAAAPHGKHLAAAQFTVTGLTGDTSDSAVMNYSALGSDHHRYTPQIGAAVAGDTGGFEVKAGQTQTGMITFVVPGGVRITSITYNPLMGSAPVAWQVGA